MKGKGYAVTDTFQPTGNGGGSIGNAMGVFGDKSGKAANMPAYQPVDPIADTFQPTGNGAGNIGQAMNLLGGPDMAKAQQAQTLIPNNMAPQQQTYAPQPMPQPMAPIQPQYAPAPAWQNGAQLNPNFQRQQDILARAFRRY